MQSTIGNAATVGRGEHAAFVQRWAARVSSPIERSRNALLLIGPPGTGKTMIARAIATQAQPFNSNSWEHVYASWMCSGIYGLNHHTTLDRPFRAPHHTCSTVAMIGYGDNRSRPGEVSLAHGGVLLLDEVCEFRRPTIEAAVVALSEGVSRLTADDGSHVHYPSEALLIATASPCPCGWAGTARQCRCSADAIARYWARLAPLVRLRPCVVSVA